MDKSKGKHWVTKVFMSHRIEKNNNNGCWKQVRWAKRKTAMNVRNKKRWKRMKLLNDDDEIVGSEDIIHDEEDPEDSR